MWASMWGRPTELDVKPMALRRAALDLRSSPPFLLAAVVELATLSFLPAHQLLHAR